MMAGDLRHRVRIDSRVMTQDPATGEQVVSWTPFLSDVPADISPLSGREYLAAQAEQSSVSTRITIRLVPGIVETMRIVNTNDGNKIYSIAAVLPDPTLKRHLTIMCDSGVNSG